MTRLLPVSVEHATGKTAEMLHGIQQKLGRVPNLMAAFGQSPAALGFFVAGSQAIAASTLPPRLREQIDLLVSELNGCDYCLAAHTAIGQSLKLTVDQIRDARQGRSFDPKTQGALTLARRIVDARGKLGEGDFDLARQQGLTDAEIADVFAIVALKIFTNYFAIANEVPVDFPAAPAIAG